MKTLFVLLSCVYLAASFGLKGKIPIPRNEECGTCLWVGVYNVPSFQSCTRFTHCIHGFQFENECENGEIFDHRSLTCAPAFMGRCVLEGPVMGPPGPPPPPPPPPTGVPPPPPPPPTDGPPST